MPRSPAKRRDEQTPRTSHFSIQHDHASTVSGWDMPTLWIVP
jgi:hypothetical protein